MAKRPSKSARERSSSGDRLPLRWAIIIGAAAFAGSVADTAAGHGAGITAVVLAIGLLHAILD
jgi:hypothetical protein